MKSRLLLNSLTSVSDISLASEGSCGRCCGCGCVCVEGGPVLARVGVFVVTAGAESVGIETGMGEWAPVWGKDMAKTEAFSVEAVSMCFLDYEYVCVVPMATMSVVVVAVVL